MHLSNATRLLKALGDDTRLRLLHLCSLGELSVGDLVEILNMGQSRVSTQLTLLKEVGLVTDRKVGRRNLYSLGPNGQGEPLTGILANQKSTIEFSDLGHRDQQTTSYW